MAILTNNSLNKPNLIGQSDQLKALVDLKEKSELDPKKPSSVRTVVNDTGSFSQMTAYASNTLNGTGFGDGLEGLPILLVENVTRNYFLTSSKQKRLDPLSNFDLTLTLDYSNLTVDKSSPPSGSFTVPMYVVLAWFNPRKDYEQNKLGIFGDFIWQPFLVVRMNDLIYDDVTISGIFYTEPSIKSLNLLDTVQNKLTRTLGDYTFYDYTDNPDKLTEKDLNRLITLANNQLSFGIAYDYSALSLANQNFLANNLTNPTVNPSFWRLTFAFQYNGVQAS